MWLERHDPVEGHQGKDERVDDGEGGRETINPGVILGLVVTGQHPLIPRLAAVTDLCLGVQQVGEHIAPNQPQADRVQNAQANQQPRRHPGAREPERLPRRDTRQRRFHIAVDVVIAHREDQDQPDQRDGDESRHRLGEAEDHPRPLGIGNLVHGSNGDRAAGERREEEPVDVKGLPGPVASCPGQREREDDQPDECEHAAHGEERAVISGHTLLGQLIVHRGEIGGHQRGPPAAGGSGDFACSERT